MAVGNLFLGTARRKVGDVVLYRRDGVQQARVRVRTISNPKSEAQSLQRNYLAPVSKFYAPLSGVLEKSWEGLNRSRSHNEFNRTNIDLARQNGWYVDKYQGFTPLPYKVSHGTLSPLPYAMDESLHIYLPGNFTADSTVADFTTAMVALGYQVGDQVTVIACLEGAYSEVRPTWMRFFLNSGDTTKLTDVSNGQIAFSITDSEVFVEGIEDAIVAGAVIISRQSGDKWLRSSQFMVVADDYMANHSGEAARARAIASYSKGSTVNPSDVYLDGSEEQSVDIMVTVMPGSRVMSLGGRTYGQTGPYLRMNGIDKATMQVLSCCVRISGFTTVGVIKSDYTIDEDAPGDVATPYFTVTPADTRAIAWLETIGVPSSVFQ